MLDLLSGVLFIFQEPVCVEFLDSPLLFGTLPCAHATGKNDDSSQK